MHLWLIRHPEPETTPGQCYGSLDVPLSERGVRQAQAVAGALRDEPLAAIYTSPRRRCQEAAEILAEGRGFAVEPVQDFRELDFGEFEGYSYDEIAAAHPELYRAWMERPTEVLFPGGESFELVRARVTKAAALLRGRHHDETIAIVTHGGPIRILIAEALGMPGQNIFRLAQQYGAMNLIRYFEGSALVEMVNVVAG